ncbi:CYTH domain-containing protein [Clostridium botulinum]|uniref:CYTH domain-containing protein n=1 Tax=Clostridium botulinum TaxID=1491 RepID=UPI0019674CBB|nr:CYTH domain-containing protein [Clostridium botulinum]MBN1058122.1 CYTH domain-containing protein [Clostridium botulinum]MBN1061418.1 CYTH domain-containing protein [Clostridium botulinum]
MEKVLGKTIRDSIHGDIFIENKYMKIVNTKEFQRLRRINQLSVGNYIFPSAQHTRFSHSIGTFHLMKKIIQHIEGQLNNIHILISEKDKELSLLIALLHDVGHGPFSHAFEGVLDKDHEQWTKEIILGDTEINREIVKNFGKEYPKQLVELISKDNNKVNNKIGKGELNLFFVIKSLISSQLDADRLDYLVRDARSTGVVFGDIDLSRIIKSIRITEVDDEIYVCVLQKNVLDIKNYLLARDNMHESVYFHPSKCELEEIIKLIFKRCRQLVAEDCLFEKNIPNYLKCLIKDKDKDISLEDYVYLDDYVIITFFKSLLKIEDYTLNKLCTAIINREKYKQIRILNNEKEDIDNFKGGLTKIITNNSNFTEEQLKENYYLIEILIEHTPYKRNKEQVYVLANDGTIKTLESVVDGIEHNSTEIYTFINLELLLELIEIDKKEIVRMNVNKLINIYKNRNHIEIERKFLLKNIGIDKISDLIKDYGMDVQRKNSINQIDRYYDTKDKYFYNNDITCRVREKENKLYATVKTPARKDNGNERFEYEFEICNYNITTIAKKMKAYVNSNIYNKILESNKVLEVNNNRSILEAIQNDVKYEIAYDVVSYNNVEGEQILQDNELEIELKSNYYHRVHLKKLTDYLLENTNELVANKNSKYRRGMEKIDMK